MAAGWLRVVERKELKRNAATKSLNSWELSQIRANEMQGVNPFTLLRIGSEIQKIFVRAAFRIGGERVLQRTVAAKLLLPGHRNGPREGNFALSRNVLQNQNDTCWGCVCIPLWVIPPGRGVMGAAAGGGNEERSSQGLGIAPTVRANGASRRRFLYARTEA